MEKYRFEKETLGKGAFGIVHKAFDSSTGRIVAIKEINLKGVSSDDLKDIMMEIDLLKCLEHEFIVRYIDSHQSKGTLYIILEYMEGGSLADSKKKYGKLAEGLLARYVYCLLRGLVYLHSQGIVHRDIKGANLLCTKDGDIKLADFGVATRLRDDSFDAEVAGTPYWMAPEVIQMSGVTSAADVWSVGATTIELLTGKPPYFDLPQMSALFRIVDDASPPIPTNTSPDLKSFLQQCFVKNPANRPAAKDLLSHPWLASAATTFERVEISANANSKSQDGENSFLSEAKGSVREPPTAPDQMKFQGDVSSQDEISSTRVKRSAMPNSVPNEDLWDKDFAFSSKDGPLVAPSLSQSASEQIQEGSNTMDENADSDDSFWDDDGNAPDENLEVASISQIAISVSGKDSLVKERQSVPEGLRKYQVHGLGTKSSSEAPASRSVGASLQSYEEHPADDDFGNDFDLDDSEPLQFKLTSGTTSSVPNAAVISRHAPNEDFDDFDDVDLPVGGEEEALVAVLASISSLEYCGDDEAPHVIHSIDMAIAQGSVTVHELVKRHSTLLLLDVLERKNSTTVLAALRLFSSILEQSSSAGSHFIEVGLIDTLALVVDQHKSVDSVLLAVLELLASVAEDKWSACMLAPGGAMRILAKVAERWQHGSASLRDSVVQTAYHILSQRPLLVRRDLGRQLANGHLMLAVTDVVKSLPAHSESKSGIWKHAMQLVTWCSLGDRICRSALASSSVAINIAAALDSLPSAAVCSVLKASKPVTSDPFLRLQLAETDSIAALCRCLHRMTQLLQTNPIHDKDEAVKVERYHASAACSEASHALYQLIRLDKSSLDHAASCGVIPSLTFIALGQPSAASTFSLSILGDLAHASIRSQKMLIDGGAVDILWSQLAKAAESPRLAELALESIAAICAGLDDDSEASKVLGLDRVPNLLLPFLEASPSRALPPILKAAASTVVAARLAVTDFVPAIVRLLSTSDSNGVIKIDSLKLIALLVHASKHPRHMLRTQGLEQKLVSIVMDDKVVVARQLAAQLMQAFQVATVF